MKSYIMAEISDIALMKNIEVIIMQERLVCNPNNYASRKTCEYAGGKLLDIVELPESNDMRERGEVKKCIFRFDLG